MPVSFSSFFFLRKKGNNGFPGSLIRGVPLKHPRGGRDAQPPQGAGSETSSGALERHWKRDLGSSKYLTNFFINQKML